MSETDEEMRDKLDEQPESVTGHSEVDGHDSPPSDLPDFAAVTKRMLDDAADVDVSELLSQQQKSKSTAEESTVNENLEELAHDMLGLIRRMRDVETAQQSLMMRLDEFQEGWSQSSLTMARELDTMRRELLGDRKHTALTNVFNEQVPLIDRLRTMRDSLDEDADARIIAQLNGVLETLAASLRRLGYQEFDVKIGEPFDSDSMECAGYAPEGEAGLVLEIVRSGYRFDTHVLRLASVIIANPKPTTPEQSGDDFNE